MSTARRALTAATAAVALTAVGVIAAPTGTAADGGGQVDLKVFAPHSGDLAGIDGKGWFVDLAIDYPSLAAAGFSGLQLTGPATHNNTAPFPGAFSPGRDEKVPGLVVLVSTATVGAGAGQNLANLFNLTGVTNREDGDAQVWDTWIVGDSLFGTGPTELTVAVIEDLNGNGVFDDAPDVVADADGDGRIDKDDIDALGATSQVRTVSFAINGAPAG